MRAMILAATLFVCAPLARAADTPTSATANPYAAWKNWPMRDANFFPLAVWAQSVGNVGRFKEIGINLYVAVHGGPLPGQLEAFEKAGMPVICAQNEVALKYVREKPDGIVAGWMHGDEPDNAQSVARQGENPDKAYWKSIEDIQAAWPDAGMKTLAEWGRWGPPIPPKRVVADYEQMRKNDPTRPIMLNLGQGVAYENAPDRGYRSRRLEDYPEYIKGCDIVSFDIYPVVHNKADVRGNLWFVPRGVERLRKWADGRKPVWNCVECTHINDPNAVATPHQIRAEAWMGLIAGSQGIIYFVHEFKPEFSEPGVFKHPRNAKAIAEINRGIHSLAPVLNSPAIEGAAQIRSSDEKEAPVAAMVKRLGGATYVFAVAMRDKECTATFQFAKSPGSKVQVLDEGRSIDLKDNAFQDKFTGYEVHLYRVAPAEVAPR
jgi:hypothetical protein